MSSIKLFCFRHAITAIAAVHVVPLVGYEICNEVSILWCVGIALKISLFHISNIFPFFFIMTVPFLDNLYFFFFLKKKINTKQGNKATKVQEATESERK